ncbi:MAG: DUF3047 domain-containing protein [Rhodoferax sp.]|nr:DUF3047 domain-containing protein [Rhodoferax sp.]
MKSKPPQSGFLLLMLIMLSMLAGCASQPSAVDALDVSATPWATVVAAGGPAPQWTHQQFPGKRASQYRYARVDGRDAVRVQSSSSISMLRQVLRVEPGDLGRLRFSWKVPTLITSADMKDRDVEDSPVRVVLAFEGDRSKFSARDAMLSELAHALTGEPLPYATLMYVWCNETAAGTVLNGNRTGRIRKLVLESGGAKLNQWLDYERDIRADFEKAYGEPPGALVAIGIMTDTDNTRSAATAWYGPVRHIGVKRAP